MLGSNMTAITDEDTAYPRGLRLPMQLRALPRWSFWLVYLIMLGSWAVTYLWIVLAMAPGDPSWKGEWGVNWLVFAFLLTSYTSGAIVVARLADAWSTRFLLKKDTIDQVNFWLSLRRTSNQSFCLVVHAFATDAPTIHQKEMVGPAIGTSGFPRGRGRGGFPIRYGADAYNAIELLDQVAGHFGTILTVLTKTYHRLPRSLSNTLLLTCPDEIWFDVFQHLAHKAWVVFVVPESSSGVIQEIKYVAESLLDKMVVLMPPERILPKTGAIGRGWDEFSRSLKPDGIDLPEYDSKGRFYRPKRDLSPGKQVSLEGTWRSAPAKLNELLPTVPADNEPFGRFLRGMRRRGVRPIWANGNYALLGWHRHGKRKHRVSDRLGQGVQLWNSGYKAYSKGHHLKAAKLFGKARAIGEEVGNEQLRVKALFWQGTMLDTMGHHLKAVKLFGQARAIGEELGNEEIRVKGLYYEGKALVDAGRFEPGLASLRDAASCQSPRADASDVFNASMVLIRYARLYKEVSYFRQLAGQAREYLVRIGRMEWEHEIDIVEANLEIARGNYQMAHDLGRT